MPAPPDYVDVAERIREFRVQHPEGSLRPLNPAVPFTIETVGGQTFIAVVAAAYRTPDDQAPGVGMAWEPFPGPTNFTRDSELQNAETSAWGRAIIASGAADAKRVASANEVANRSAPADPPAPAADPGRVQLVRDLWAQLPDDAKAGKSLDRLVAFASVSDANADVTAQRLEAAMLFPEPEPEPSPF